MAAGEGGGNRSVTAEPHPTDPNRLANGKFAGSNTASPGRKKGAIPRTRKLGELLDRMTEHGGKQMPEWEAIVHVNIALAKQGDASARDFLFKYALVPVEKVLEDDDGGEKQDGLTLTFNRVAATTNATG